MKVAFGGRRIARAVVLAAALCIGCGEKEDYRKQLTEERERHREEIARLQAGHAAEIERYEERLRLLEAEFSARGKLLVFAGESAPGGGAVGTAQSVSKEAAGTEGPKDEATPTGEETEEAEDSRTEGLDYLLEWFAYSHAPHVPAGKQEQFQKDFDDYIEGLREQSAGGTAAEKKDGLMDSLRERIAGTTDEEERELLENRLAKIEGAAEEDLAGVIDYYQKLDNNRRLNELMDEYDIPRQELREYGIEPPPRDSWRPDPAEIAYNLRGFVDRYEPLTAAGEREQYRGDFERCIADITAEPTDAELLARRNQMVADTERRLQTADDAERPRLERRKRWLERADAAGIQRSVEMQSLRELDQLTEKYGIPRSELGQSGVWFPGRRRRRD